MPEVDWMGSDVRAAMLLVVDDVEGGGGSDWVLFVWRGGAEGVPAGGCCCLEAAAAAFWAARVAPSVSWGLMLLLPLPLFARSLAVLARVPLGAGVV